VTTKVWRDIIALGVLLSIVALLDADLAKWLGIAVIVVLLLKYPDVLTGFLK
jgi:hypothetical protein